MRTFKGAPWLGTRSHLNQYHTPAAKGQPSPRGRTCQLINPKKLLRYLAGQS